MTRSIYLVLSEPVVIYLTNVILKITSSYSSSQHFGLSDRCYDDISELIGSLTFLVRLDNWWAGRVINSSSEGFISGG